MIGKRIGQAAKAIYAGVFAALGALGVVLVGDMSLGAVTDGQWVAIAVVGLGAFGGVYRIKNASP